MLENCRNCSDFAALGTAGFDGANATTDTHRATVAAGTQRLTRTPCIIRENGKAIPLREFSQVAWQEELPR